MIGVLRYVICDGCGDATQAYGESAREARAELRAQGGRPADGSVGGQDLCGKCADRLGLGGEPR